MSCSTTSSRRSNFSADVVRGLSRDRKYLPCKYFYDERGSRLFDEICELDEYYLTRTERSIMEIYGKEMAAQIGERVLLVELGSGSSVKTRVLLENLENPAGYVPVDISAEHLMKTADSLSEQFPGIEILPLVADFTRDFRLPTPTLKPARNAIYFPGSTIGNFDPGTALDLLDGMARIVGKDGGLLIGIDLQKDPSVIHDAYNDSRGVTAEFNLNLLHRMNSELGADFDVDQFQHLARYNEELGRVEIFIVSLCRQSVTVDGREFEFTRGERIFTEYSHKYTIEGFSGLASQAGFRLRKAWSDADDFFAVLHFVMNETD